MPQLALIDEWEGNIAAITDQRLPSGPLALQFYEGFPTPFIETAHYTCPRPDWLTEGLPSRLGYELDRPFGENPLPVAASRMRCPHVYV